VMKSNDETLALTTDTARADTLRKENEVLGALLPKKASLDDLVTALAPVRDALLAAKNDGQATGIAMKHLRASGVSVQGNDAAEAAKKIRSGS
jgi:uncharacterized protein